jgi:hypothetical protein
MQNRNLRALGAATILQCGLITSTPLFASEPEKAEAGGAASVLFSCRGIKEDRLRLECYDREVGALQEAEATAKVVIVDQEVVKKARRDLFGFSLPRIALFSKRSDDAEVEEIKEIEDSLASFRIDSSGRVIFTLSNGARWAQADNTAVLGDPKVGETVRIETAALGSFKASIGGRRAIRVKRVN